MRAVYMSVGNVLSPLVFRNKEMKAKSYCRMSLFCEDIACFGRTRSQRLRQNAGLDGRLNYYIIVAGTTFKISLRIDLDFLLLESSGFSNFFSNLSRECQRGHFPLKLMKQQTKQKLSLTRLSSNVHFKG